MILNTVVHHDRNVVLTNYAGMKKKLSKGVTADLCSVADDDLFSFAGYAFSFQLTTLIKRRDARGTRTRFSCGN